jgi:ABC-type dipeptide/oligopeptide/nickel transport system permease component
MTRYIFYRVIQAIVVIWIVATLVFVIVRLTPGDAAQQIAGPDASREQIELVRGELGLNDSLWKQYSDYMTRAVRGDFRDSLRFKEPAMGMVMERFPATLKLAALAFVISVGLGGLIGVGSALRPGGAVDRFGKYFAILGQSMPSFWVGLLFILLFAVRFGVLPAAGYGDWKHYILPAATLGWFSMAAMMRLTRSAMLDVLDTDYVKLLRIKGLSMKKIVFKHALRNAAIPILTLASLQLVAFLSGSVVVETIFAWPGVGRLMVESVTARDYTVVQAATFLISVTLVTVNLLVDLTYAYIDPRIRYS